MKVTLRILQNDFVSVLVLAKTPTSAELANYVDYDDYKRRVK